MFKRSLELWSPAWRLCRPTTPSSSRYDSQVVNMRCEHAVIRYLRNVDMVCAACTNVNISVVFAEMLIGNTFFLAPRLPRPVGGFWPDVAALNVVLFFFLSSRTLRWYFKSMQKANYQEVIIGWFEAVEHDQWCCFLPAWTVLNMRHVPSLRCPSVDFSQICLGLLFETAFCTVGWMASFVRFEVRFHTFILLEGYDTRPEWIRNTQFSEKVQ